MILFYLPDDFYLLEGLNSSVADRLCDDDCLGALMAKPDCVVAVEEAESAVWICGSFRADVVARIQKVARLSELQQCSEDDGAQAKKRRTDALSLAAAPN